MLPGPRRRSATLPRERQPPRHERQHRPRSASRVASPPLARRPAPHLRTPQSPPRGDASYTRASEVRSLRAWCGALPPQQSCNCTEKAGQRMAPGRWRLRQLPPPSCLCQRLDADLGDLWEAVLHGRHDSLRKRGRPLSEMGRAGRAVGAVHQGATCTLGKAGAHRLHSQEASTHG